MALLRLRVSVGFSPTSPKRKLSILNFSSCLTCEPNHIDSPPATQHASLDWQGMVLVMEYRRLGSSGMYVSEISYGNWITHGSQVESDAAIKCVRTAYDLGITTFDTPMFMPKLRPNPYLGKLLKDSGVNLMNCSPKFIGQQGLARTIAGCLESTSSNRATPRLSA